MSKPKKVCALLCLVFFLLEGASAGVCAPGRSASSQPSAALVTIESVNAAGPGVQKAGAYSGTAALFLSRNPGRIVKYARSGSGVIIDPRGILVTNAHIVRDAAGVSVKLFDGTRAEGRILQVIPETDIAFLSIVPPFPLAYVPLANSDGLLPGAKVYCMGHALDHNRSLFGGEVSAVLKQPAPQGVRPAFVQVRFGFHLYSGDSGSPILDRKGYLLGLVSGGRRGGDNAALAIASNVIRDAYRTLPK
ncbi:MAG TPA: serine protease [Candidatus Omnitrophota bacterium]|nr:serine protease [Candidatus Omnitrophota bacterium]